MKSILDPSFKYQNSAQTDLHKKFAKIRADIARQKKAEKPEPPKTVVLVRTR